MARASVVGFRPGAQGVVGVDDGQIHVRKHAGDGGGLQLLELQILGIVHNVVGSGGQVGAVVQGNQALGLQQQEGAALIGGIVGNGNDGAVGQILQGGDPAA